MSSDEWNQPRYWSGPSRYMSAGQRASPVRGVYGGVLGGIEGMLNAIRYAREEAVPYFGICLGMQTACIEYARNVCGLKDANSGEFDPATPYRIIYKLRELTGVEEMGGTMRLGAWDCVLEPDSLAAHAYGAHEISERHRHRLVLPRRALVELDDERPSLGQIMQTDDVIAQFDRRECRNIAINEIFFKHRQRARLGAMTNRH